MKKLSTLKIILISPIFFLLASYLSAFPHEYAHATVAWLGGYKENPFAIQYGGISWSNLLFLSNIDENVNYQAMLTAGHFLSGLILLILLNYTVMSPSVHLPIRVIWEILSGHYKFHLGGFSLFSVTQLLLQFGIFFVLL